MPIIVGYLLLLSLMSFRFKIVDFNSYLTIPRKLSSIIVKYVDY